MTSIFITGFPHCGTTILRKLIGNAPGVCDIIYEYWRIPNNVLIDSAFTHAVCKQPCFTEEMKYFLDDRYDCCDKRIIILRNPLFVFSSLNKRFGSPDYFYKNASHTLDQFEYCCKQFLYYKNQINSNTFVVKYEDLFLDDCYELKRIFKFCNLTWCNEVISNKRLGYISTADQEIVTKHPHLSLRQQQINSEFCNFNEKSIIDLPEQQLNMIRASDVIKQIYTL